VPRSAPGRILADAGGLYHFVRADVVDGRDLRPGVAVVFVPICGLRSRSAREVKVHPAPVPGRRT